MVYLWRDLKTKSAMKRTIQPPKPKDVTNRVPLAEGSGDMHRPSFLDKLKSGFFEGREDLPHPKRGGAHILFKNDFMRQVYYLARLGARDSDIAEFFGVSNRTIDLWKSTNHEYKEAWQEGHWMFGMKVGETLGQRALGYDYTEVEHSQHVDRQGNIRDLVKTSHKHMAPDTVAIIFYLKNRFRDTWADVNKTEIDARMNVDITKRLEMVNLTEEERKMIKSIAIKSISPIHGVTNN